MTGQSVLAEHPVYLIKRAEAARWQNESMRADVFGCNRLSLRQFVIFRHDQNRRIVVDWIVEQIFGYLVHCTDSKVHRVVAHASHTVLAGNIVQAYVDRRILVHKVLGQFRQDVQQGGLARCDIQALEKELNMLLFERRGPKICLTPAGQLLLDMSEPLVAGIDSLVESFSAAVSEVSSGPLDIASGESTLLYILPELTKHFMDKYPSVNVRLHLSLIHI